MKSSILLSALGLGLGLSGVANAKIVKGTSEGYLSKVYATDMTGARMAEYDRACETKHWAMLDTHFYADFRVNTESKSNVAFMRYAGVETQMMNSGFDYEKNKYVFSASELSAALTDMNVESMEFTLDYDMWHATSKLVFSPVTTKTAAATADCSCDCHHDDHHGDHHGDHHHGGDETDKSVTYQCVLSTY